MFKLHSHIQVTSIHSDTITCITLLSDQRIVTGSGKFNSCICITSIDLAKKTWDNNIKYKNAHKYEISSLCEIKQNELISSSFIDMTLWKISFNKIQKKIIIHSHSHLINKILLLKDKSVFLSCSNGGTIKIWKNEFPPIQHEHFQIREKVHIKSMIELQHDKTNNLLVASVWNGSNTGGLFFYDKTNYSKVTVFLCCYTTFPNGMIEISNGYIALSQKYKIIIVSPFKIEIVKEFHDKTLFMFHSSLSVLNSDSFIYAYDGIIVEITSANDKCEIIKTEKIYWEEFGGSCGLITLKDNYQGRKYIVSDNNYCGFGILCCN